MTTHVRQVLRKKKNQNPQYEWAWRVILPQLQYVTNVNDRLIVDEQVIPAGGPVPANQQVNNMLDMKVNEELRDPSEIDHRIVSIDVPFTQYDTRKNIDGSAFMYTASNSDIGNVTLRVDEMEDGLTLKYFLAWQGLIENEDGSKNLPYFYKRDIVLWRMTASGRDTHISIYQGYFPTEIAPASYNYESGGIMQHTITCTGDDVAHAFVTADDVRSLVLQDQITLNQDVDFDKIVWDDDLLGQVLSIINKGQILLT